MTETPDPGRSAIDTLKRLAWRSIGPEKVCADCNYRLMADNVPPDAPQHWESCGIAGVLGYKTEPMVNP